MSTTTEPTYRKGELPGPCSICGGKLRYQIAERLLTCRGCRLELTATGKEAGELNWYQAAAHLQDIPFALYLPALLARHHIYGATIEPEVKVIGTHPRPDTYKALILPVGTETPAERAERLGEQARLNGVQVTAIRWDADGVPVLFRATSQERGADGQPVRTYQVTVTAQRVQCPCQAAGFCAHLKATHDYLLAWYAAERDSRRTPAEVQARGKAALSDLWGDERG